MRLIPTATISTIATALLVAFGPGAARADTVVQIPLTGVLDARSVTTLTNGNIVVFTISIDGGGGDLGTGGLQNGFATKAVAMQKSPANVANSLPDDGHFPADTRHPEVVLNFSNAADPASPQNHIVKPTGGTFSFPVPGATYSKLFLFFHGANGGTTVKITLTYSDATTDVTMATIPDFFNAPTDPKVFVLAPDLAKWSKTTTIAEANHHNIFGVEVAPMAKALTMVKVERGATGYLNFWGATGIATGAVSGLPDAGADASPAGGDAGAAGAGGGGGVTGVGGASGAGGAGGANASGGAGASGGGAGGQSTGAAGIGSGAAGTTSAGTGGGAGAAAAGTAGASGTHGSSGGGSGCSCRLGSTDADASGALWLALGAAALWCQGRKRRAR